jgi:hypothetical protein
MEVSLFPPPDFRGRGTTRRVVEGFFGAARSPSTAFGGASIAIGAIDPLQMQGRK